MTTKDLAIREEEERLLTIRPPAPVPMLTLRVTPEGVENTKMSIGLLRGMVKDLLQKGIDYGRVPGIKNEFLFDPGASTIISGFNCFVAHRRILKLEIIENSITAVVEVPLISRANGQEVGSGIGAASTEETKYKYRWVRDPLEWGYDDEARKTLRTHVDKVTGEIYEWRIPNPEKAELINTVIKMASKRAEVDAAEALPGVAAVLRELLDGKVKQGPPDKSSSPEKHSSAGDDDQEDWTGFWGETRRLGYADDKAVHTFLKVKSMKEWLATGQTLDQALDTLRGTSGASTAGATEKPSSSPPEAGPEAGKEPAPPPPGKQPAAKIDEAWLTESLRTLKWNTVVVWLTEHYHVSGKKVSEIVPLLTEAQRKDFAREIQDRLNMSS